VLAAARGGRQLPRPAQLNVARRTLALLLRGWHGGPRPQQHLLALDGGAARRLHSGSARRAPRSLPGRGQKPESRLRDHPLAHLASSRVSWFHMGKPVRVLVRTADELAAVRDGNPAAPPVGTFGGYEMTPAPACRCTLWQRECAARAPYCLLVVEWRLSDCRSIPFGK